MMKPAYHAKHLSPILPVESMERSIGFYTEVLGFDVAMHTESYSLVSRDTTLLHLTRAADESVLAVTRGHFSIYLEVEEIEPLWAHVSQFKERYKIRDRFDREYGMREFHIIDPDGCLIFVGQEIRKP